MNLGTWYAPFLFSIGLVAVIITGVPLFTGRIGFIKDDQTGCLFHVDYLSMLCLNCVGASLTAQFAAYCMNVDISKMVSAKLSHPLFITFSLSCGCGLLMFLAVYGYRKTKSFLPVIFSVATFIICGFDHCVANVFYFRYAIITGQMSYSMSVVLQILVAVLGNAVGAIVANEICGEKSCKK